MPPHDLCGTGGFSFWIPFAYLPLMAIGISWGKEKATLPTMKKRRVKSRPSAALVPVYTVDHGARITESVRTIITKYKEMREASQELQRLNTILYVDKFDFDPAVPALFRWYLHHRLLASLEEESPPKGGNAVLFASRTTAMPQEAFDLIQQFIAES